jgi:hypothetical protein
MALFRIAPSPALFRAQCIRGKHEGEFSIRQSAISIRRERLQFHGRAQGEERKLLNMVAFTTNKGCCLGWPPELRR